MRLVIAVALLVFAWLPQTADATIGGYMPATYRAWIKAAQVPMPNGPVRLDRSDCWGGGTCADAGYDYKARPVILFLATDYQWSQMERKFLLYHELGHAFDILNLKPGHRRAFKRTFHLGCGWWHGGCNPSPSEMFAEQYASCAAGLPRLSLVNSDAWFYNYAPPPWVSEAAICDFIRSAG